MYIYLRLNFFLFKTPLEGLAFFCRGFAGQAIVKPLYERKEFFPYLVKVGSVPFVFKKCVDGVKEQAISKAGKTYTPSMVCFVVKPGARLTKEEVQTFVEGKMKIMNDELDIPEEKPLVLDDDWYHTVDRWESIIGNSLADGCTKLVQMAFCKEQKLGLVSKFLKENKGHVHSLWKTGGVPKNVITKFHLTERHYEADEQAVAPLPVSGGSAGEQNAVTPDTRREKTTGEDDDTDDEE